MPTPAAATPTGGGIQTVRQALFGKLLRRVVKAVVSVAKSTVDLTRNGLTRAAGLFLGSRLVNVDIDVLNTDHFLNPAAPMSPTR